MKHITIRIPESLWELLNSYVEEHRDEGMTASYAVRKAIKAYLSEKR